MIEVDGRAILYHGDCLEVLKTLPDCSVDSVVTDPPAGIAFMGKSWDKDKGGRDAWIAWMQSIARECLRVIKPGGHALVWALPRTSHWTGMAWENAGWEPRDKVVHLFGCLTDDTEILINGKWEPYQKAVAGSLALCYDAEKDTFAWLPIQETYIYDYYDTAFRIQSDRTDQVVTRTHRCLVERDGKFVFEIAESLSAQERVPVLESVSDLLAALPVPYTRASGTQPLVPRLQPQANVGGEEGQVSDTDACLPNLHHRVQTQEPNQDEQVLFGSVSEQDADSQSCRARKDEADSVTRSRRLDGDKQDFLSEENDRRGQSRLEGRRDNLQEARQLQGGEVCSLPERVCGDGSEGRLHHGASFGSGEGVEQNAATDGGGSSHGSRPDEQCAEQSVSVCDEQGTQTVRASRFTTSDVVRIEPFHLDGVVWCVKVPTRAFVARRNGKVFVTGNTGFPKSLNVSKQIDKAAGAEREVVGRYAVTRDLTRHGRTGDEAISPVAVTGTIVNITSPATAEAHQWQGWGTALKPASEDWWLMRKPLSGTVAGNVLAHGTGALNIDGCRIETEAGGRPALEVAPLRSGVEYHGNALTGRVDGALGSSRAIGSTMLGRWPANVLHDGSDEVVAGFPSEVKGGTWNKTQGARYFNNNGEETNYVSSGSDSTVGSAARFFYCAKASVKDREEGLDDLPYGTLAYSNGAQAADNDGADEYTGGSTDIGLNNIKKRKNTHPTVKHTELMRYLCRLITPPNGVVLDAFMGSGSTGKAAMLEGFNFIGIEMEAEYLKIAEARISYAATGKTLKANPEPDDTTKVQSDEVSSPVQTSLFDA